MRTLIRTLAFRVIPVLVGYSCPPHSSGAHIAHATRLCPLVRNAMIGRNLVVAGGSGDDDIVVDGSRIGLDTRIVGQGGNDDTCNQQDGSFLQSNE